MTPASPAQSRTLRPLGVALRIVLGVFLIGAAVGVYALLSATRPIPAQTPISEVVRPVRTVTARLVEIPGAWEGYGTARALRWADVGAEVTGAVTERPDSVRAGAWLSAGDLIVAIDPVDYEQRLARARQSISALRADLEGLDVEEQTLVESLRVSIEALRLARWEADRLAELQSQGAANVAEVNRQLREVTRFEREEQQFRQQVDLLPVRRQRLTAQIDSEEASARLAATELARTRITAPITGALQAVDVQEGERVAVGQRVARIVDTRVIEVPVRLPLSAHGALRVGDVAEMTTSDGVREARRGKVARIAPEADPETRTLTAYVEFAQSPGDAAALTPGQFVRARIESATPESRIVVPRSAVTAGRVFIVDEEGRARQRAVDTLRNIEARLPRIDPNETQWTVIGAGLAPGDRIIVSNLEDVSAGSLLEAVDVVPESAARAGALAPSPAPPIVRSSSP